MLTTKELISGIWSHKTIRIVSTPTDTDGFEKSEEEWAMWTVSPLHHANMSPEGEKQKHLQFLEVSAGPTLVDFCHLSESGPPS